MNITITGRHMEMTDALKSYVEGGLEKLRHHFDRVIDADVVLTVEKHRHIAEINLHANGIRINSKESSSDMYASVDTVMDRLNRQVRKYKTRINRHQPRAEKEARDYEHRVIEFVSDEGEPSKEARAHQVVHHEHVALKSMTVDEAAMQLELVEEGFLVFSNADTQRVNVIHARDDGTYGLIEPQF